MTKQIGKLRKPNCPYHGNKEDVVRIIYGFPMPSLEDRAKRGEVKLGGCVISENDPQWYCKKCKKDIREVLVAG